MKILDFAKDGKEEKLLDRRFEKALGTLKRYKDKSECETDAFRFVSLNAMMVKMRFDEAQNRLKKKEIRPIVKSWAHELLKDGKEYKSKENLLEEINLFDESAMLTPTEFFAVSDIIISECTNIFVCAFERTLNIQKAMIDAEKWMDKDMHLPIDFDPVFYLEHALRLSKEKGDFSKRKELIECLKSIGKNDEEIVNTAGAFVSDLLLRLTNAVATIHAAVDMDWMDAYLKISQMEKTLSSDPSGIYKLMDEESKSAIRREIEAIHRKTHAPERRIAFAALKISENEKSGITQIIYTDEGRKKLIDALNAGHIKIEKMIPDPNGQRMIPGILSIVLALSGILLSLFGPLWLIVLLPCVFVFSEEIVRKISHKFICTRPLLSLKLDQVAEDNRTLVVIPALLASEKSVKTAAGNLASYGAHEKSPNIDFLLLGDFKDSKDEQEENDEAIVNATKSAMSELNRKEGRKKYYFLIRNRTLNEADRVYMGYERKRGALMDLNRLLLGYGNRFSEDSSDANELVNRYRYVLTVDMDTKILPGTIRKMIGTIAHPLNAEYTIIQPRMENTGFMKPNLFASMMAGFGGTDHYDICASDFYQDMTGEGQFAGKGIYNIRSFYEKTAEAFQENTILSHDMIEGILSKAGYAGNIVMYESFPKTTGEYYKRLDRWTRGDWQLIHYMFGRLKLNALGRYKIAGNLIRSLKRVSLLIGIILAVWTNQISLLTALLVFHFLPFLLSGIGALKPCLMNFALLPITSYTEIRAALTALVRLYITKQKRLEWVTAAESEKTGKSINYPGIVAAILILPGLFVSGMQLPAMIMELVFALGKDFIDSFERLFRSEAMQASDYTYLTDLAKRMWRYFEKHVPLSGSGFPPDNVQIDPPIGEQARTSPTNIGMYLISVIGAKELGLIDEAELITRINQTLSSIKRIETWHGLMYNWYDIHTLLPVHPKYVSSVDAGNLMAAFVVVRNYLKTDNAKLSSEFDELIRKMEIEKLYNRQRKLFRIGVDAENNRMSASHYDLYSSESRILSFTSMAEKGISVSHWKHLARPFFFHKGKSALYSWSGTMFEYMMPNLLMPSACGSLMRNSMETAIDLQTRKAKEGIWGISEAGYASFDRMLNYQYKAFGIRQLSLSGEANESVYAPYAVLIAFEHAFSKGMESLKNMQQAGMKGEYGFYEAIDFTKENQARIVYSYMSHHQGMGFIALTNLLTDNSLRKYFLDHPNEQALTPLLNEKPFLMSLYRRILGRKQKIFMKKEETIKEKDQFFRLSSSVNPEGHLLFSGNALAYFENTGRSFFRKDGIYANLFRCGRDDLESSLLPEIHDGSGKARITKCRFDSPFAEYEFISKIAKYKVICTINPENEELLIKVTAKNETDQDAEICIRHAFRISLSSEDMNYAHPVFSDLFVKTEKLSAQGIEHTRKNRDTLEISDYLYHLTDEEIVSTDEYGKKHGKFSSLARKIKLLPNEKKEVFFSVGLEKDRRNMFDTVNHAYFERAKMLLMGQMNAHIQFCGLNPNEYHSADKKAASVFSLSPNEGNETVKKSFLWPLGLSGEGNVLLVKLKSAGDIAFLRKAIRMHEFLKFTNIPATLVILKVKETEYFTPLKDAALNLLLSSHLSENIGNENGTMIFDINDLDRQKIVALESLDIFKEKARNQKDERKEQAICPSKTAAAFDLDTVGGFNGYGGFLKESNAYAIKVSDDHKPPRRWSNFLVNEVFGALVNDLGISCIYYKNSRMGRITAFDNNLDDPRQSVRMEIVCNQKKLSLFPGTNPNGEYTTVHDLGKSIYKIRTQEVSVETTVCVHPEKPLLLINIRIENQTDRDILFSVNTGVRFLMGVDDRDLKFTNIMRDSHYTMAYGCAGFVSCAAFKEENAKEGGMRTEGVLKARRSETIYFFLSASESNDALALIQNADAGEIIKACEAYWSEKTNQITISTGNLLRDKLSNGFMKYQSIASRYFARFGPYQPGGAFGMRDQLQDLLSIMYFDKELAKAHILMASGRQFEKGDGLHWWHMPANGVRTRISDDVLFLPVVTAKYVEETGDNNILYEKTAYLKDREIPENECDLYASFEETDNKDTLYEHIMKAFRYTERRGRHGLLLMGSGDWNDGMNRVGANGEGESVWLSMFWIYAANEFKASANSSDRKYLEETSEEIRKAIETHAWDGKWYLRAFYDDGRKLGSSQNEECRIDLITQAWAVLSGLDKERAFIALKSAEEYLIDKNNGIVRLLYPPFTGQDGNPGYIAAYPPGTRENGGQYTHAVTWLVKAYAKLGNAQKAWEMFDMLHPINRCAVPEKASKYGGEPYVIAADISDHEGDKGECGWTWYTGAAAWAVRVLYEDLFGLEIRGDQVRIKPLLGENMDEVKMIIRKGEAKYNLISKRDTEAPYEFITMTDDGKEHTYFFSSRK